MAVSDAEAVLQIYQEGLETGQATFQTTVPPWEDWDKGHVAELRFVALYQNQVAGWIALSPVSARPVYRGVAEVSVYIGKDFRGRRIGLNLMENLISASEDAGYWTLQASVFPENISSIALHHRCGFRTLGYREKVGQLHGIWRDTVLLERRSKKVNYQK
jgi:L-amino acid N-acyltransferase YncA